MKPKIDDLKNFDLWERTIISNLQKEGVSLERAVQIVINTMEGDDSQLSDGIKKFKNN